jgi:hypothetical protein
MTVVHLVKKSVREEHNGVWYRTGEEQVLSGALHKPLQRLLEHLQASKRDTVVFPKVKSSAPRFCVWRMQ